MNVVASDTTIVTPGSITMDTLCNAETRARFPWVDRYRIYDLGGGSQKCGPQTTNERPPR